MEGSKTDIQTDEIKKRMNSENVRKLSA